jgi:diguanylate cyclase (GGDEF)-like protein
VTAAATWSTQQLAEFLAGVARCRTEDDAIRHAVEAAAEALEAEVCVFVLDGEPIMWIGFPADSSGPESAIAVVTGEAGELEVPGLGECPSMAVPVPGEPGGHLVIARAAEDFDPGERNLVRAMGRALSLSIEAIGNFAAERERRELVTRLSRIQRSISHHAPLQDVLDAISGGASELLREPIAGLVMIDPDDREMLITRSVVGLTEDAMEEIRRRPRNLGAGGMAIEQDRLVVIEDYSDSNGVIPYFARTETQAAIAAPVREAGEVVGALVVASRKRGRHFSEGEREVLSAFAEHASLALTDARLSDQVERARHDALTGLPNRSFLNDLLTERLEAGPTPAVISLDLDDFRSVNDRIGHRAGDQVLIELCRRLRGHAGPDAVVARLEGDAFALLCEADEARKLAEGLIRTVAEPFKVQGREIRTTASVGLVDTREKAEQMLRDADLAMYRAKSEGGARVVVFEPGMHAELVKRLELQDDLARALREDEIVTYFQPKVELRTARVIGVEGLVRWRHPERGMVSPAEFLALAEAGGHMQELTEEVIGFSTRAAGDWWHSGLGLQLSVNLAPSTLCDPEWRLDEFVARTLARTGLPGKALQFEVTEDALMVEPEIAADHLTRLSALGATISIDDFGTGHSSLGRLKSLPIDELKIDRSFIFGLTENEGDKTIVRSTIHLAHQMGLQVIAEGVETQAAWQQLRGMGCEGAQGFLIAKPMPAREVPAWLASWNQQARELRSAKRAQRRTAKAAAIRRTQAQVLA